MSRYLIASLALAAFALCALLGALHGHAAALGNHWQIPPTLGARYVSC